MPRPLIFFSKHKGHNVKRHTQLIMGRNCIAEVLAHEPERIVVVYTSRKSQGDALFASLLKHNVSVKEVSKVDLARMVSSESHQSYVAVVREREEPDLRDFLEGAREREKSVVLLLDSIYDPQNLGAIIRAAECFGVDLVVFSKNRGTDITPVATKTSAGATELVPILKVSNLVETLKAFQKEEYRAVACEARERSQSLNAFEFPNKMVLVLGSEGKGIQPLLSKTCDFYLSIPMLGAIDSLNVSQAAAVILSHAQREPSQ